MPVTMDALKAGVFLMYGDMQGAHWCAKQTTIFCISRVSRALFKLVSRQHPTWSALRTPAGHPE